MKKLEVLELKDPKNTEWVREHGAKYKGKWIALKNGKLLGSSNLLLKLVTKIKELNGVSIIPL